LPAQCECRLAVFVENRTETEKPADQRPARVYHAVFAWLIGIPERTGGADLGGFFPAGEKKIDELGFFREQEVRELIGLEGHGVRHKMKAAGSAVRRAGYGQAMAGCNGLERRLVSVDARIDGVEVRQALHECGIPKGSFHCVLPARILEKIRARMIQNWRPFVQ
jgi:hypothetical protein